ncbi:DUF3027 domain-containing protein [Microbacterium sp. NPDC089698]|uniref:DUF3027 domain-containing protein n=1 Tax=Microbacterium sp. NPDC089698 TaxID=3364200 RepID=UPI0037F32722
MPESDVSGVEPVEADQVAAGAVAPAVEERFSADEPVAVLPVSERLLGARDLALVALHEITPAASVGPAAGYLPEVDGVLSLRFENRLGGYPGWYWTVSVAQVGDEEPTVLEAELLPGDGALLAPEWVPWAERLADYRAHQAELAASAQHDAEASEAEDLPADELEEGSDADDLDDDLDEDELDDDELDDDVDEAAPRLHAGDLDGVDIDELDDSIDSEDDDSDDDSDDEDSEEE